MVMQYDQCKPAFSYHGKCLLGALHVLLATTVGLRTNTLILLHYFLYHILNEAATVELHNNSHFSTRYTGIQRLVRGQKSETKSINCI
jgi:hypothetical protein